MKKFRRENILTPAALKEVGVLDKMFKPPMLRFCSMKCFNPTTIVFTTCPTLFLDVQYLLFLDVHYLSFLDVQYLQESDGD